MEGAGRASMAARDGKGVESMESMRAVGWVVRAGKRGRSEGSGSENQISLYCSIFKCRLRGLGKGAWPWLR
jgi:hypothetical protein